MQIEQIKIFTANENPAALDWEKELKKWITKEYPEIRLINKNPQAIIALGGDGTILKAAKECAKTGAILVGFNLGKVGFLASVRNSKNFYGSLKKVFSGDFSVTERIMLDVSVARDGKEIFSSVALNEVVAMNPLGMVEIDVFIEDYHLQKIKGTGAMVATPTGSTGFNLSAHGPVVMPDMKSFILVELFDHNIPTPPIILNENQGIVFKIAAFRERNLLVEKKTKKDVDVILTADGDTMCKLAEGDIIKFKKSLQMVKFAELEKNYFLKSLQEKFDFK